MCGRYSFFIDLYSLINKFKITSIGDYEHTPSCSIYPGQQVPVIISSWDGRRNILPMKWGLIPYWADENTFQNKLINARAETIDKKPSFKKSFKYRRCLIPADGFYEWSSLNNKKQRYKISLPGGKIFAFAGIYDKWVTTSGEEILTFSIITTAPNDTVKNIHDRMPVILTAEQQYTLWLEEKNSSNLLQLLKPYEGKMEVHPHTEKSSLTYQQQSFDF